MFGLEKLFGLSTKKFTEQMKKGEQYRLIFKCSGTLSEARIKKATEYIRTKMKEHLKITKIAWNEPEYKKLTVEGIALHDPIPFLLIGGLVGGVALLVGIRLALESVFKVLNVFSPNKILLLCALIGIPYLIFSGRLPVKGLKVKGLK